MIIGKHFFKQINKFFSFETMVNVCIPSSNIAGIRVLGSVFYKLRMLDLPSPLFL